MKIYKNILAALLVCAMLIPQITMSVRADTPGAQLPYIEQSTQMRGLWVTSAYNLDWPSRQGLTPAQIRAEIDDILYRAANQGINAVFVQVRPVGDALYRSEIFPWSHLITGTQGVAPAGGFDPLEYWVQQANALGIEVHAWLNPFRVTFPNQRITNPAQLAANHPARLDPSLVVTYGTGLIFDPGNPAARQVIVDGAAELLRNYNLAGIHLDDHFYPSRNFPDQTSFARYGNGMNIHDWRRENVNALIRDLQRVAHEADATFGVSPFAIWQNAQTDPRGSQTRGFESFHSQYVDSRRWVLEGWVDYIVPQIYWFEGNPAACFELVLTWWEDLVADTDVRLYIGLAPYREVQGRDGWEGQIIRQLERIARSPVAQGSIFFRERFMRSDIGDAIGNFYAMHLPGQVPTRPTMAQPTLPPVWEWPIIPLPTVPRPAPPTIRMDRLIVAQPSGANRTMTDAAGFWFYGSAVPDTPVYVNGQLITNRTQEGFFSVFMPLERGQNVFTFTQDGQPNVTRTITNNAPPTPQPPATMAVGITNVFPVADEWARVGTTLTLRATAPAGATVTAQIGGQTISLTQTNANLRATANNIVAAQFTGTFILESPGANNAIIDIGRPVYTMTWEGQTRTVTANGQIRQIGLDAPFFAEVTGAATWVFPGATATGGSSLMLSPGQVDRVAAISGNWTRLASGGWVENANIRTFTDAALPGTVLSDGTYSPGRYWDIISWNTSVAPVVLTEFDGEQLIVSLGRQNTAPPISNNIDETLFSEITIGIHNGTPAYFMTLREGENLEGFYTAFANGRLELRLRRRRPLTTGNYPFAGFTFVLDAGHGGNDPGAVGPMGGAMAEADIVRAQMNLIAAQLRNLGAEVITIGGNRDTAFTLQQRVNISRNHNPDMFISLHTNATVETHDATNTRGFTVWFRNENSRPAAQTFLDIMHNVNPGTNRNPNVNQANFFVVRPMWSPAILLEASFTNNIHDFSWLVNPVRQEEYARAVVNALLAYYR